MKILHTTKIGRWFFNHLTIRMRSKILYYEVRKHNNKTTQGTLGDIFTNKGY